MQTTVYKLKNENFSNNDKRYLCIVTGYEIGQLVVTDKSNGATVYVGSSVTVNSPFFLFINCDLIN